MKLVKPLCSAIVMALVITGCNQNSSKPTVTIKSMDFIWALYSGKDHFGKSKEEYVKELTSAGKVIVQDAFIFATLNIDGVPTAVIGDNTPRILCQQKSAAMPTKKGFATVEGGVEKFSDGKLYLNNCSFEYKEK